MTEANDDIDLELEDDIEDDDIDDTKSDEDTTDWKAEAERQKGIAKRYKTKLAKAKEGKTEAPAEKKQIEKSNELDYGQKAFLRAEGIKGSDELSLVQEYLASGKSLDDIIDNKHFINDLNDLREDTATKNAIPSNNKRGGNTSRDSVEYWIAKGELPPPENFELRQKVVNAKIKASGESNSPFRNN